ncbi:MAG TPA: hypothetical protein VF855_12790 [Acidimicrobiales bacterium]
MRVTAAVAVAVALVVAGCASDDGGSSGANTTSGLFDTTLPGGPVPTVANPGLFDLTGRTRFVNVWRRPDGRVPTVDIWALPTESGAGSKLVSDLGYGQVSPYVGVPVDAKVGMFPAGSTGPGEGMLAELTAARRGEQLTNVIADFDGSPQGGVLYELGRPEAATPPASGLGLVVLDASGLPRTGDGPMSFYVGGPAGSGCLPQDRLALSGGAPVLLGGQNRTLHDLRPPTGTLILYSFPGGRGCKGPIAFGPWTFDVIDGGVSEVFFYAKDGAITPLVVPVQPPPK